MERVESPASREKSIKIVQAVGEGVASGGLFGADLARMSMVWPTKDGFPIHPSYADNMDGVKPPIVTPENTSAWKYNAYQHSGNIFDGYAMTFGFYYFLTVVPKLSRLSEKVRLGTAWVASNLVVAGVETGFLTGNHRDILDIPAGIAGSTLFLGAHYIGSWLAKRELRKSTNHPIEAEALTNEFESG